MMMVITYKSFSSHVSLAQNKKWKINFPLPGFRFHPTDEELLSFYLRRRVEKKPITLEIIKEIDIYKYNPWDLASFYNSGGEKEWYFFCKRGRKYKNSMRPNRVTGCGFWKATGIDKSIYSPAGVEPQNFIIGLKKTLVFYRGSAGKGTKTDWMMHEFRLPSDLTNDHEAEIWTLCRILKRDTLPRGQHITSYRSSSSADKNSKSASSGESDHGESYISFGSPSIINRTCSERKPVNNHINEWTKQEQQLKVGQMSSVIAQPFPSSSNISPSASSFSVNMEVDFDLLSYGAWEELKSAVDFDLDPSPEYRSC